MSACWTCHARASGSVPAVRARSMASITSPYTSSWNWSTAALPTRTGAEPRKPGSHPSSTSVRRRSPAGPYMIWRSSGLPAAARTSQSRHADASRSYPPRRSACRVKVASRSQQYR